MRLGVLDVGSNTVHMLVVDAKRGAPPLPMHSRKWKLRLAERANSGGRFDDDTIRTLAECIANAAKTAEQHGVDEFFAFATAVLRDAPNCDAVVEQVKRHCGIELTVLGGEEEARLTFAAARRWFGWSAGPMLLIDIGGGSLEIALGRDEDPSFAISYPLGAGRLTREWLRDDPPSVKQLKALRKHVRDGISEASVRIGWEGTPELAVATSKTFEQLAGIAGAAPPQHGMFVPRELLFDDLTAWVKKLSKIPASRRAKLKGVSKRRSRQLLAGAVVAHSVMEVLDVSRVRLCPWGLREGIVLRRLDAADFPAARDGSRTLVLAAAPEG
jgi:exopolyphosphatase/guanosine-5'-triphosphate,3'-diphosphate pyrophosphatase